MKIISNSSRGQCHWAKGILIVTTTLLSMSSPIQAQLEHRVSPPKVEWRN